MQIVQRTVHRYQLSTRLDAITGDVHRTIDQALLTPPSDDEPLPDLAEFELKVTVVGFPFLAAASANVPAPATPDATPDATAIYARMRFGRIRPTLEQELLAEVTKLARAHLGAQGWLVDRVAVEVGSLTLTAVLLAGHALLLGYKDLRESIVLVHSDLTQHAIPFARRVWQDLFVPAEMFPQRQALAPVTVASEVPKPAATDDVASILREIRDELKELRKAGQVPQGSGGEALSDQMRRAQEAEAAARAGQGVGRSQAPDLGDAGRDRDTRPKI